MHSTVSAVARAHWAPVLFAERPSRMELLRLKADGPLSATKIRVHRNHSFEHVAAAATAYFAWAGRDASYWYSDYDDSLSFAGVDLAPADLELVWVDLDRYAGRFRDDGELVQWLAGRAAALRALSSAPIVLATTNLEDQTHETLKEASRSIPGVRVGDLRPVAGLLGEKFLDARAAKFSGTRPVS